MPASSPRSPRYGVTTSTGLRSAGKVDSGEDPSEVGTYTPENAICRLSNGSRGLAGSTLASGKNRTPSPVPMLSMFMNGATVVCEAPYRSVYRITGAYPWPSR
jgi:hypothetical protein